MQGVLKRRLDLASAIITTVIGGLEILGGIIAFFLGVFMVSVFSTGDIVGIAAMVGMIIGSFVDIGLGLANAILGGKTCCKPVDTEEGKRSRKKVNIALVVLLSVVSFLALFSLPSSFFMLSAALTALGLKIAVMVLPDMWDEVAPVEIPVEEPIFEEEIKEEPTAEPTIVVEETAPPVEEKAEEQKVLTLEEKLAELKRLKELGALTEEQYQAAVRTLIENLTK